MKREFNAQYLSFFMVSFRCLNDGLHGVVQRNDKENGTEGGDIPRIYSTVGQLDEGKNQIITKYSTSLAWFLTKSQASRN